MSAVRLAEVARHVTERDREIALCLYEQQLLATDQLTLLFFSSRRRAQDRLLFLYRQRVLDRLFPLSRFGAGKPQAHWLLDEAGAHLVASRQRESVRGGTRLRRMWSYVRGRARLARRRRHRRRRQVHHRVPLRDGGSNELDNLELLCHRCHARDRQGG